MTLLSVFPGVTNPVQRFTALKEIYSNYSELRLGRVSSQPSLIHSIPKGLNAEIQVDSWPVPTKSTEAFKTNRAEHPETGRPASRHAVLGVSLSWEHPVHYVNDLYSHQCLAKQHHWTPPNLEKGGVCVKPDPSRFAVCVRPSGTIYIKYTVYIHSFTKRGSLGFCIKPRASTFWFH